MSDKKIPLNDGYQPKPKSPSPTKGGKGIVTGGYQPPTNQGGSPTNPPPKKK